MPAGTRRPETVLEKVGHIQRGKGAGGCLGGVQPSHRPKAGVHERFSLLQPSHSRPQTVPTVPSVTIGYYRLPTPLRFLVHFRDSRPARYAGADRVQPQRWTPQSPSALFSIMAQRIRNVNMCSMGISFTYTSPGSTLLAWESGFTRGSDGVWISPQME
jgi:hypothetical protein